MAWSDSMNVPCYPVSVKALIEKEGKFLFILKDIGGKVFYGLPGGLKELGESLEEALVREVKEETGLLVKPVKLLAASHYIHHTGVENVGLLYYVRVVGGELRLRGERNVRFIGYKWLSPDELDVLDPKEYREYIRKAVEELRRPSSP